MIDGKYQKAWEEYRRLRNRQYVVAAIGLVVPALAHFVFLKAGMSWAPAMVAFYFIATFSVVAILAFVLHFHKWRCPACGEPYFVRTFWVRFPEFLPNCMTCGLPKYSGSDLG